MAYLEIWKDGKLAARQVLSGNTFDGSRYKIRLASGRELHLGVAEAVDVEGLEIRVLGGAPPPRRRSPDFPTVSDASPTKTSSGEGRGLPTADGSRAGAPTVSGEAFPPTIADPATVSCPPPQPQARAAAGSAASADGSMPAVSDGPQRPPSDVPMPQIEGYRIKGQISDQGGQGTVWRAVQLSTDREVAPEFLQAGRFSTRMARVRFESGWELEMRRNRQNRTGFTLVELLIAAIRKAGPNRTGIRDALRDLCPWTGVTGAVRWDRWGGNTRSVPLGTIHEGRFRTAPKPRDPGGPTLRAASPSPDPSPSRMAPSGRCPSARTDVTARLLSSPR